MGDVIHFMEDITIGQFADQFRSVSVDRFSFPDDCDLVPPPCSDVTVETHVASIELPSWEPLVEGWVGLVKDAVPRLEPFKLSSYSRPELLVACDAGLVHLVIFFYREKVTFVFGKDLLVEWQGPVYGHLQAITRRFLIGILEDETTILPLKNRRLKYRPVSGCVSWSVGASPSAVALSYSSGA
jgi:hypothetical protein